MTDDLTHDHLRALLADAIARAEKAEAAAEHEHAEMQRQAKLAVDWMIDAQRALAACAEMRAALLDALVSYEESGCVPMGPILDLARALLSRPDLGAGKVLVAREVVERAQRFTDQMVAETDPSGGRSLLADLDALLKKGGAE